MAMIKKRLRNARHLVLLVNEETNRVTIESFNPDYKPTVGEVVGYMKTLALMLEEAFTTEEISLAVESDADMLKNYLDDLREFKKLHAEIKDEINPVRKIKCLIIKLLKQLKPKT